MSENGNKLGMPKQSLLFVASLVWAFAGSMLLYRGTLMLAESSNHLILKLASCLVAGVFFFYAMFVKISGKNIKRIKSLPDERPSVFLFFNRKGYIMMVGMISLGIFLRKTGIIPVGYLALIYITMGIPLLISAVRFLLNGFNYNVQQQDSPKI
ncbi:MAG: hypothetical protein ACK5KP_08680 [Paludibacteraceae bacterium]